MDSNTENEEIGIDLKSQEKQTDQVSDKSGIPCASRKQYYVNLQRRSNG